MPKVVHRESTAKDGLPSRTYAAWQNIRRKIFTPNHPHHTPDLPFEPAWEDYTAFLEDVGRSPGKGWQLRRRDLEAGYVRGNLEWVNVGKGQGS